MLTAIVTSPRNDHYGVNFYYLEEGKYSQDWDKPMQYLPCRNYEHAKAVAVAFMCGGE